MIVSHVIGGIGNQMFQYAVGRALSHNNKLSYSLDISGFEGYSLHNGFELDRVFNIQAGVADEALLKNVLGWQRSETFRKILKRSQFKLFRSSSFLVEPHFNYWPQVANIDNSAYLYGYWQSEHYFKSVEDLIRKEFEFKNALEGKNLSIAESIKTQQAVSLHIRRGDYITDSKTSKIMNVCSVNYYQKAIKYIVERVNNPVFYVFSDDVDWVRGNISISYPCYYVDHNRGSESYRDMQLMSLCNHHIIANSSFSWWGAWLGANTKKIVVAPKDWFLNGTNDTDLIPDEWVRM